MHRFSTRLAVAGLLLSLAPDTFGQTVINPRTRRGIMSGSGLALVLQGDATDEILLSPPGDQTIPPAAFNRLLFPHTPDFRIPEMFDGFENIQLDAISTGNDFIGPMRLVQSQQRAAPDLANPLARWQTVHVSVADSATGLQGSLLKKAPLANQGPEGAVFGHYLYGSTGIPNYLLDATALEQSSRHLGFPPNSDDVIAGMDWALAVRAFLHVNPWSPPPSVVFLASDDVFYFSVTESWALANQLFALEETGSNYVQTRGADIYQVTWSDQSNSWGPPRLYLSAASLGLTAGTDDLDALALDATFATAIFSTTVRTGLTSQIRAYQLNQPYTNPARPGIAGLPFASTDGELMTTKLGLKDGSDDVTGICDLDPELGQVDAYIGIDPFSYGIFKEEMGLCLERVRDSSGKASVVMQATGQGDIMPTDSSASLLLVQFVITPPAPAPMISRYVWYDEVTGAAEWTEDIDPNWVSGGLIECTAILWDVGTGTPQFVGNSWRLKVQNN